MEEEGHEFFISARDRSIIQYLLSKYSFKYFNRGKGKNGMLAKFFYIFIADFKLLRKALKFKPDIFLSFAIPYTAHVAWLLRKPHVVLDDTEHARFGHALYKSFSQVLLNPCSFQKDFGKKQIRFNSFIELCHLHPKFFKLNPDILELLNLKPDEKYVLLRFVSWNANHDIGQCGLDLETKKKLIDLFERNGYKIFISTEASDKDVFFDKYLIKIPPEYIHDVMGYASLLITEGATMASECAMLGTPAIYVNSLDAGTLREQEDKYKLIFGFRSSDGVIEKVKELLSFPNIKAEFQLRCQKMLSEKINLTDFLVWFIENYPQSVKIMKENPDYQYKFLLTSSLRHPF
jgi:predicted glycosyltransferase